MLLKSKTFIHPEKQVFVDSGYQGIQNIHKNTFLPFKKSKYNQLTPIQKEYNKTLSKIRIKIEHVFAKLKSFKILSGLLPTCTCGGNNEIEWVQQYISNRKRLFEIYSKFEGKQMYEVFLNKFEYFWFKKNKMFEMSSNI